ncbi:MAG: hypothetical protein QM296_00675 [Bacillota bacterium]|nr:hypothetical protein [Bacillota bacterium]
MKITLDMVDEVMRRKPCDYSVARAALEATDGDILAAIEHIETHETKQTGTTNNEVPLGTKIMNWLRRLHATSLRISKGDRLYLNLPGTIALLVVLFTWPAAIIAILLLVIFGYRFTISGSSRDKAVNDNLNRAADQVSRVVNQVANPDPAPTTTPAPTAAPAAEAPATGEATPTTP